MSTECVPSFCIPDLCSFFDTVPDCELLKDKPATINEVYSTLYVLGLEVPILLDGVANTVETTLFSGLFRVFLIWALPFILTLIILTILLIRNQSITFDIGILFIVFTLVLFIITIFWVITVFTDTVTLGFTDARDKINENWVANESQIKCNLRFAFFDPDGITCEESTPQLLEKYRLLGAGTKSCNTCKK